MLKLNFILNKFNYSKKNFTFKLPPFFNIFYVMFITKTMKFSTINEIEGRCIHG